MSNNETKSNLDVTIDLLDKLKWFVDTFADTMLADSLAEKLTCSELETMAELLEAAGRKDGADVWRELHARGDDEGDLHYEAPSEETNDS